MGENMQSTVVRYWSIVMARDKSTKDNVRFPVWIGPEERRIIGEQAAWLGISESEVVSELIHSLTLPLPRDASRESQRPS
jgi:hypothetical protein